MLLQQKKKKRNTQQLPSLRNDVQLYNVRRVMLKNFTLFHAKRKKATIACTKNWLGACWLEILIYKV